MARRESDQSAPAVLDEKAKSVRLTHSASNSISGPSGERKNSIISASGLAQLTPQAPRSDVPIELLSKSMRPRTADRSFFGRKIKSSQPAYLALPIVPSILQDPAVSIQKKRGHEAYARGDFKLAFLYYDDAMKKDIGMKYPKVIRRRGICLEKLGLYSQAAMDYAMSYNLTGTAEDLESVHRMERKIHHVALIPLMDGEAAFIKGEYEKAVSFFTRAILADGSFAEPYYKRGVCYEKLNRVEEAISDLIKADYRYTVVTMKKRCTQALTRLEAKLHAEGEKHKVLGDKAYDEKKWDVAVVCYTAGIEADPQYALLWVNRGLAYEHLGNYVAALNDLAQAHRLMTREDGLTLCVEAIDRLFKKMHKNGKWAKKKGDKAVLNSKWTLGAWWYSRAIKADRTFPHAYFNRALCKENLGQLAEALADYVQARELFKREDLVDNCQKAIERIKRLQAGKLPYSPGKKTAPLLDFTGPLELARQRSESNEPELTFLELTDEEKKQKGKSGGEHKEHKEEGPAEAAEEAAEEVAEEAAAEAEAEAEQKRELAELPTPHSPVSDLLKWGSRSNSRQDESRPEGDKSDPSPESIPRIESVPSTVEPTPAQQHLASSLPSLLSSSLLRSSKSLQAFRQEVSREENQDVPTLLPTLPTLLPSLISGVKSGSDGLPGDSDGSQPVQDVVSSHRRLPSLSIPRTGGRVQLLPPQEPKLLALEKENSPRSATSSSTPLLKGAGSSPESPQSIIRDRSTGSLLSAAKDKRRPLTPVS